MEFDLGFSFLINYDLSSILQYFFNLVKQDRCTKSLLSRIFIFISIIFYHAPLDWVIRIEIVRPPLFGKGKGKIDFEAMVEISLSFPRMTILPLNKIYDLNFVLSSRQKKGERDPIDELPHCCRLSVVKGNSSLEQSSLSDLLMLPTTTTTTTIIIIIITIITIMTLELLRIAIIYLFIYLFILVCVCVSNHSFFVFVNFCVIG